MRTPVLIVVSLLFGLGLGVGSTWARFGFSAPNDFELALTSVAENVGIAHAPHLPPADGPQPKAEVSEEDVSFGRIESGSVKQHVFFVKNAGQHPLEMREGGTTCTKCTISGLSKKLLQPGDTAEVEVKYSASTGGEFRQSAIILTNDRQRPRLTFTVSGKVVSAVRVVPADLVFSSLNAKESRTAEAKVLAYLDGSFEISKHEFIDDEIAKRFGVELRKLATDELGDADARSGYQITVTVQPGLPVGAFHQELILHTNLPKSPTVVMRISGQVASDISLVGSNYNDSTNLLSLGGVPAAAGVKKTLLLLIRGPERRDVRVRVARVGADALQVAVGEPVDTPGSSVVRVPVTLEVKPGSAAVNLMGPGKERLAEVTLETTHSQDKEVQFFVQFAVER